MALVQILTEPKNALVKQYQRLFEMEDVRADAHPRRAEGDRPQGHRAQDRRARPALDHGRHPARHHVRAAEPQGCRRGGDRPEVVEGGAKPLRIYADRAEEKGSSAVRQARELMNYRAGGERPLLD